MKTKTFISIFLLIVIGGIILMGLFHVAVKSHGQKGFASEWNADHRIQGNIDFRHYAAMNMLIESRNDWPAGPALGRVIWRSDLNAGYIWNGTGWSRYGMRTYYWSCPGSAFTTAEPDIEDVWLDFEEGWMKIVSGGAWPFVPVNLPHGAVVTGVIVYGTATDEPWWMRRIEPTNPGWASTMATANINTEDTTITNPTIDNQRYSYQIHTDFLSANDHIFGARITYTL